MKFLGLVLKNIRRNPLRAGLTFGGVAVAIFVFTAVLSLHRGLSRMLNTGDGGSVLVVFDRFQGCPPQSKLPVSHRDQIADIPGVQTASASLFKLSSCASPIDVVAMYGIEADSFRQFNDIDIPEEVYRAFASERGAAIVGEKIARRYGWQVGQAVTLEALGGVSFTIRGIFRAPGSHLDNVILVDLEYLQFATNQIGTVTLVHVLLADPDHAARVSETIDGLFSSSAKPTKTIEESAFLAGAVSGMKGIVDFSRWMGYTALGIILIGVGNSLAMSVRDRTREIAILKTIGFRSRKVLGLVVAEASLASMAGGILGATAAWFIIRQSGFHLTVEGFSFAPAVSAGLLGTAIGLALLIGFLAALPPALAAARRRIVPALREVD